MMPQPNDLIILVADKNMEHAVKGILCRHSSLQIRAGLSYQVYVHPERDPGCANKAVDFLRSFYDQYKYAIVLFDFDGCGVRNRKAEDLELLIESRLADTGWEGRTLCIVIEPELENWLWTRSPELPRMLDWKDPSTDMFNWMHSQGLWLSDASKPHDPKECLETILRRTFKPRSSSVYFQVAKTVSLRSCTDRAFVRFRRQLQMWFPSQ